QLSSVLRSARFDTIQIQGVHLMNYLPVIFKALSCRTIVIDWHNIESEAMWRFSRNSPNLLKKLFANRTARLIERAEDHLLEISATHTVTSERERQILLARNPNANVKVIPNGIDVASFSSQGFADAPLESEDKRNSILLVGSMDYHANID